MIQGHQQYKVRKSLAASVSSSEQRLLKPLSSGEHPPLSSGLFTTFGPLEAVHRHRVNIFDVTRTG
ncbi:hypothetical protein Dda_0252 [Drechslerella dactyloides]|uniref:Uncharacterized protein n=1 Tax=Drechslerella dactyloides TaxID=74499 RepID=A0AAD6J4J3_DREDA|nr:hypothetical protein Dda_0252 [Drechslerella dactyloides]